MKKQKSWKTSRLKKTHKDMSGSQSGKQRDIRVGNANRSMGQKHCFSEGKKRPHMDDSRIEQSDFGEGPKT